MSKIDSIYYDGTYLEKNPDWDRRMHLGKRFKLLPYSPIIRSSLIQCARSAVVPAMSWYSFKNYYLL